MIRHLVGLVVAIAVGLALSQAATSALIPVINPGGELYVTPPNVAIPLSPVPPADGTGWNATSDTAAGNRGVEGIGNNAFSGTKRLAFGAVAASDTDPEDAILFQRTSHVVAEGNEFALDFWGRGFFEYGTGVDAQASFFGYLDDNDAPVQVDTKVHTHIPSGTWTAASHAFSVVSGSPLIGRNLVIGFYTSTGDGGGFSAVDDVSLTLVPEPASIGLLTSPLMMLACRRRTRR